MKFPISTIAEKTESFIQLESFLLLWILLVLGFAFYKLFLKAISQKRHRNLKGRFLKTLIVLSTSSLLALIYWKVPEQFESFPKVLNYFALLSFLIGSVAVIKLGQILVYLFLFFKNISQGIPRLIVNLFTIVFSLFILAFIASEIFAIQVTALLATSAVFSLVLGLAMQDTLGNLFSGVSVQIGQPFKIGDWIEVNADARKWTGQVQEITWRATFLSSFSDEWIMIPNKVIAQSQIVIFTNSNKVLRHSLHFRLGFNENIEKAKELLMNEVSKHPAVLQDPAPRVLLIETTESWLSLKIFYSIKDFSLKYRVSDQLIETILGSFRVNKVSLASNRISLERE